MPMPRKNKPYITVGGRFEPGVAVGFRNLARSKGVSMKEALRRVMVQAILDKQIPGVDELGIEKREQEKYGREVTAVPLYDGEEHPQPSKLLGPDGQVIPAPPSR